MEVHLIPDTKEKYDNSDSDCSGNESESKNHVTFRDEDNESDMEEV